MHQVGLHYTDVFSLVKRPDQLWGPKRSLSLEGKTIGA